MDILIKITCYVVAVSFDVGLLIDNIVIFSVVFSLDGLSYKLNVAVLKISW